MQRIGTSTQCRDFARAFSLSNYGFSRVSTYGFSRVSTCGFSRVSTHGVSRVTAVGFRGGAVDQGADQGRQDPEFDPLTTCTSDLELLEGVSDDAKRRAKEELQELSGLMARLGKWRI